MDRPATSPSLLDHFAALEDPRQRAKVLYPLPEILLLLLCATLAGADDVTEVGLWGGENLAFLRRFLPYRHGIPSHDTLGEVLAALDPELFEACFTAWVEGLREAELIEHCRRELAHFKAPRTVMFGPLPKTSTGKVQKFALRERARAL